MEKLYKKIANKLDVSEESVQMGISEAINSNMSMADENREDTSVDLVVKDIIELFYCLSIDEQLKSGKE